MRLRVGAVILGILLGWVTVPLVADQASACVVDVDNAFCQKGGTDSGKGGGSGGGGETGGGAGGKRHCQFEGAAIPCAGESGSWSVTYLCYLRKLDPQPAKSDPRWAGRTDGAIYSCFNPYIPSMPGVDTTIWLEREPEEIDL